MSKKILFSAIGGNDPVSSATEYDGSMLHICRMYQPDIVYLYLSKEMLERQKKDDRYRYCLEKLGEKLNHQFEVHCIERGDLVEVQEYDYYYEDFKKILQEIEKDMDTGDILLANIASGTPAMKSALLILATIAEYQFIPIQVKTPTREINIHLGKDVNYDPEYYWEVNRDNEENTINRCIETKCPNLVSILKKNIILKHVNAYNYTAALMLAEEMKKDIPDRVYQLLQIAVARIQLDFSTVSTISNANKMNILPVKNSKEAIIFEYVLGLKIKMIRKEYGDFIRAISPLIADLFELILKEQCKVDIQKYCKIKKNVLKWDIQKLNSDDKGREIKKILDGEFNLFRETAVAASNLKPLLMYYLQDEKLKERITKIRDVEDKVRNMAAHEIVSVTDDKLKKILTTPMTINQVFNEIKALVIAAKIHISQEDWNSYDKMNEMIEQELAKEVF